MATLTLFGTEGFIYNTFVLDGQQIFNSYTDRRKLEYAIGIQLEPWADNVLTSAQAQTILNMVDFKADSSLSYQKDDEANDWYYEKQYPTQTLRQYSRIETVGFQGFIIINK